MSKNIHRRWRMFWLVLLPVLAVMLVAMAQAAPVTLEAYVTYSLFESNATSWLPDGSVIMIIGSGDNVNDGMMEYGGTNLIADSTQGDDIFIGEVTIDTTLGTNGVFYSLGLTFDTDDVNYLYIRFFDMSGEINGMVNWGTSPMYATQDVIAGYMTIDFGGLYATTNYNNFVVIPEPGTAQLVLLFGGMMVGLYAAGRKSKGGQQERNN